MRISFWKAEHGKEEHKVVFEPIPGVTNSKGMTSDSESQEGTSNLIIIRNMSLSSTKPTIAPASGKPATIDIAGLLAKAITKQWNAMLLPYASGAPCFYRVDVTTVINEYESGAVFPGTDSTESNIIAIYLSYCAETSLWETVMMMSGYPDHHWAALKKEMLDAFRFTNSRPDSLVNSRRYLENIWAEFGGQEDTESLKSFLCTYDHISHVVTKHRMMCKYERTVMLL
ncbi:hypothetical protein BDD12DRAFT_893943 [Trichophaea hybrida]|nr:hypothetical protein BDD12DRAFT_893943 [Trichophaea hybrida]